MNQDQANEVLALKSIFDENSFQYDEDLFEGTIIISTVLPDNGLLLNVQDKMDKSVLVNRLAPIVLKFKLTGTYPEESPPEFQVHSPWLDGPQLKRLTGKLKNMWEEQKGDVVLFLWHSFVEDSSLSYLGITETIALQSNEQLEELIRYNQTSRSNPYDTCEICYLNVKVEHFLELSECGHVFCQPCLKFHTELQIEAKQVAGCPGPECKSKLDIEMVKGLVNSQQLHLYDQVLLKFTLLNLEDATPCPNSKCQNLAAKKFESENFGYCQECGMRFCLVCQRPYEAEHFCQVVFKQTMKYIEDLIEDMKELSMSRTLDDDRAYVYRRVKAAGTKDLIVMFTSLNREIKKQLTTSEKGYLAELKAQRNDISLHKDSAKSNVYMIKLKRLLGTALFNYLAVTDPGVEDLVEFAFDLAEDSQFTWSNLTTISIFRSMVEQSRHFGFCPNCQAAIEKIGGCRFIRCGHCRSQFCWACMEINCKCG